MSRVNVADYLRGFVAGYWQGFDFAQLHPTIEDYVEAAGLDKLDHDGHKCVNPCPACDGEDEGGSATGDADASSPAPAPEPATSRSATAAPAGAPADAGPAASADSSLPAIRQPALPAGVEVAGVLEGLYVHRGMTLALHAMAEQFAVDGMPEAELMCRAAIHQATRDLRGGDS